MNIVKIGYISNIYLNSEETIHQLFNHVNIIFKSKSFRSKNYLFKILNPYEFNFC